MYALEAVEGERTCGFLPLAFVRSLLFGRFLVSLPYLNANGVMADDAATRDRLIDERGAWPTSCACATWNCATSKRRTPRPDDAP